MRLLDINIVCMWCVCAACVPACVYVRACVFGGWGWGVVGGSTVSTTRRQNDEAKIVLFAENTCLEAVPYILYI